MSPNLEINDVAAAVTPQKLAELRTHKTLRLELAKEFFELMKIKYNNNEKEINENEDNEYDHVVFEGLKVFKKETTGYEVIHAGKKADKRVLKRLGRIAFEFLKLSSYPVVSAASLEPILNKAIGNMDRRPKRDYRKTILYYCNVDEEIIDRVVDSRLGELDVSGFVRRIPRVYMRDEYL